MAMPYMYPPRGMMMMGGVGAGGGGGGGGGVGDGGVGDGVCKYFSTPQGCSRGDQCLFLHQSVGGSSGGRIGRGGVGMRGGEGGESEGMIVKKTVAQKSNDLDGNRQPS